MFRDGPLPIPASNSPASGGVVADARACFLRGVTPRRCQPGSGAVRIFDATTPTSAKSMAIGCWGCAAKNQGRPGPAAASGRPRDRPRRLRRSAGRSCSTAAAPGWTGTPPPAACDASPRPPACGLSGRTRTCSGTPLSRPCSMPASTCATSRSPPGTPIPRTTMRYDRARQNLDRHPNYILAAYMASGT